MGLSESVIRYLAGWTTTSNMVEVYNHATPNDIDAVVFFTVYLAEKIDKKNSGSA
jgi:hypothetical protein